MKKLFFTLSTVITVSLNLHFVNASALNSSLNVYSEHQSNFIKYSSPDLIFFQLVNAINSVESAMNRIEEMTSREIKRDLNAIKYYNLFSQLHIDLKQNLADLEKIVLNRERETELNLDILYAIRDQVIFAEKKSEEYKSLLRELGYNI